MKDLKDYETNTIYLHMQNPNCFLSLMMLLLLMGAMNFIPIQGQTVNDIKKQKELQKLVHIKGNEQFSLGIGLVKNGWNLEAGYGKYVSKNLLIRTDFIYETVKLDLTTLNGYYLSPEAAYVIVKVSNRCFIDAKAGVIFGEEALTNQIMVNKDLNNFVFGEKIGMKFEYFLTNQFSLNIDLEQRFINNSQVGSLTPNATISLSYNF